MRTRTQIQDCAQEERDGDPSKIMIIRKIYHTVIPCHVQLVHRRVDQQEIPDADMTVPND